jgi:hypothetical protein
MIKNRIELRTRVVIPYLEIYEILQPAQQQCGSTSHFSQTSVTERGHAIRRRMAT